VAFSSRGNVVATGCADGHVRLWDPSTGRLFADPLSHHGRIESLCFSPDGDTLATGSLDGTARLWATALALPVSPALHHRGQVTATAIDPQGKRLATACSDGVVRCWKLPNPVSGNSEQLTCWASVLTDLEFDDADVICAVNPARRWDLRRRLHELGGPPIKSRKRGSA
jgi:WD40 repeat protein